MILKTKKRFTYFMIRNILINNSLITYNLEFVSLRLIKVLKLKIYLTLILTKVRIKIWENNLQNNFLK
jgi:hypothetical protein